MMTDAATALAGGGLARLAGPLNFFRVVNRQRGRSGRVPFWLRSGLAWPV